MRLVRKLFLSLALLCAYPAIASANCVDPAGVAGEQVYNGDFNVMQYCNGTEWVGMGGGNNVSLPDCPTGALLVSAGNGQYNCQGVDCTTPWGAPVSSGASVTAFQTDSVAFGSSCVSETRTCSTGILSGAYEHEDCALTAAEDCSLPWGDTLAHGAGIVAYQTASVPFGSSCQSQTRTCNNGTIGGSYTAQSCSIAAPIDCTLDGATVPHGDSVEAFYSNNDMYCNSIERTCNNGTLSGASYYNKLSCCQTAYQTVDAINNATDSSHVQVPWLPSTCGGPLGEAHDYCSAKSAEFSLNSQANNTARTLCESATPKGNATSCSYVSNSLSYANSGSVYGGMKCPSGQWILAKCGWNFSCQPN